MAQAVNLLRHRPPPPPTLNRFSTRTQSSSSISCSNYASFRPIRNPITSSSSSSSWNSLQLKLRCKGRISALFSNNNKEEQARKALDSALGGKKIEFERWNKEIQKREEMGGGSGGAGGGGWFGFGFGFGGDHFWEEAQQASLVILVLMFVYLVIAKGEALLAVVFNPMLFALRGVRNAFSYITSKVRRLTSPTATSVVPDISQTEQLAAPRLSGSAKERVIRKWATD